MRLIGELEKSRMEQMDAYIGARGLNSHLLYKLVRHPLMLGFLVTFWRPTRERSPNTTKGG